MPYADKAVYQAYQKDYHQKPEFRRNNNDYSRRHYWMQHRNAVLKLGGKCVRCGITDVRVLQINHRNSDGKREATGWKAHVMYRAINTGARKLDDLEVRCANCNILYEYETGRRKAWAS